MTKQEAKELLLHHSFNHEDFEDPKSARDFLGMLRPFNGTLLEENYHEVMAALRVLADDFTHPTVDREIIAALWGICHFARAWGLEPEGMLRSNNLIRDEQIQQLADWVDSISYATCCLLDGAATEAFATYSAP